MVILYFLIPLSVILIGCVVLGFFWAVKHDQFDDLESHGLSIFNENQEHRAISTPVSTSTKNQRD